ncbi:MAG: magnesium/cobalt transporter CorA [Candidatus Eisenbacteria bacterium]
MSRLIRKKSDRAGLPPGTIPPMTEETTVKLRITAIDYDESKFEEIEAETIEDVLPFKTRPTVTWINLDGIQRTDIIEEIGKQFGIHPLVLEDIANTGQRPKMEDFGDYLFVVIRMLCNDANTDDVRSEQVSMVVGPNFVISFQEVEGDVFDTIRDRIRKAKGRIRKMGADYLAYALIDAVVDNYFLILEKFGERIEGMEDELIANPSPEALQTIHTLKRELIYLRKSVWPLRETISGMQRSESRLVADTTQIYLRDVYDHTIQVIDTVESFRDMVSGMLDTYLSSVSNRMNEVMKVLTIIATIFIPITFIAGIYGMNFAFMPELAWRGSYYVVLGVMTASALAMVIYFRRKRWL